MRTIPVRAVLVLLTCALTACSSGDNAAPDRLDTLAPSDTLPVARTTTTSSSTTSNTATPVTAPAGTIALSADGPWKLVDSAPGVTAPGLVYELMPGLWAYLPTVEDIPNGITWVLNKDDLPVIEAYLMARLTYFKAITSKPMDLGLPGWKQWYADGGAAYRSNLESRSAQGQVADLDAGVVLRPQVIGEDRSEDTAVVFDCFVDGGVFRLPNGDLAPGSSIGSVDYGSAARLKLDGTAWIVEQVGTQPDACL